MKIKKRLRNWLYLSDYGYVIGQVIDQILHGLWGAAIAGAVLIGAHYPNLGVTLAVAVLVIPREFIDQWPINNWSDTLLDIFMFLVGAKFMMWVLS